MDTKVESKVADAIEEVDVETEWDRSPEIYQKYAEKLGQKFIIIDRDELPAVENHHEENVVECELNTFYCDPKNAERTISSYRQTALMNLAVAEYFEKYSAIQAVNNRREELAQQFGKARYIECPLSTRDSIEYIIELEKSQGKI